jgi:hypothetical protein
MWKKVIASIICLLPSAFVAWLFWCPILGFLNSLIPETAQYAWVGKLICVVLVGWVGGIAMPLVLFILGVYLIVKLFAE